MIVTLLLLLSISFSAEWNRLSDLNSVNPVFSLESISSEETTIKLSLEGYYSSEINIEDDIFTKIFVNGGASILKEGFPDLPQLSKSLIIPDESKMSIRIVDTEYIDVLNGLSNL